ncbi:MULTISPECIES: hypothetical protein [unclassified Streptomyces]|uniref:hypothetical protein n=1 Tax=unclassified Streptomyces TaxID=2593676 RepID=UPI00331EEECF
MPLLDDGEGTTEQELRWRDERDALLLFVKIAGLAAKDFTRAHGWDRAAAEESYLSGLNGVAVQPTFEDKRELVAERLSGLGVTVMKAFTSRDNRRSYDLEVTSIIDPLVVGGTECSLDAFYYHYDTGTLVVLRYLSPGTNGTLSPDARRSLDELHGRVHRPEQGARRETDDYALLDDPLFLRIHEQEAFTHALHRTSSGAIYPYGQFAAAFSAAAGTGLLGSSVDALTRHLVPTDFASLVRDGWFGARGVPLEMASDSVKASVKTVGAALVVVDFNGRPRGNGAGLGTRA